jgi:dTDP-4-amino-4,6-dideoxygalactose transaminase
MCWKIPLFKTYWDEDDIKSIENIIKRGTYWATGPEINQFEKKIGEFVGKKYCLSFNSGTSALHALFLAQNITEGEVIVPSFTFIATANSVVLAGAKPVFAEIEQETYALEIEDVKERINKKTKAIMPIHYGGLPCRDIKALKEIAEDKNILLIEDAAESLGATIDNKKVGTFGQASMFSLCQNKIISTGEGGLIVIDSKVIYEKMKLIRSHGRYETKEDDYFSTTKEMDYIELGYNFRMPTMLAALGLSQLKKIDKIIRMRREKADYYNKKLNKINDILLPIEKEKQKYVYQMYTIKFKNKTNRDLIQAYLSKKGIMTKVYFYPIHLKRYYIKNFGYKKGDLPKTEELSEKVLTLPLYPHLAKKDQDYIIKNIIEFFNKM